MTREHILSKIQNAFGPLPGLIYLYIGGSFNTSFFTDHSDIDMMIVWNELPDTSYRNDLLARMQRLFSIQQEWTFLDKNGPILRDAIKLQNFRKIEIYHHDLSAFQCLLERQNEHEGLSYSISNRIALTNAPELEAYIDTFTPDLSSQRQNLCFSIISDLKKDSFTQTTIENITQLFALEIYGNIPARKHWQKILNLIPENSLLNEMRLKDWISQSLEFLITWSGIAPRSSFDGNNTYKLKKHNGQHNTEIFRKIQIQKNRLQEFLSWPSKIQTPEDQNKFAYQANIQWQSGIAFHFQIFHDENFSGAISIHTLNYEERSFEFGYWVDQDAEGLGLITKGLQILLNDMTSKGWKQAKITSNVNNIKSQRVAKRLGMTLQRSSQQMVVYSLNLNLGLN